MTPTGAPGTFENVSPILRVRDLRASIDYYVSKLGFKLNWETPNVAGSLRRHVVGRRPGQPRKLGVVRR
jgi:catechol 2,3-dioxygenase-like lactoylglutathione lyase family enzyme